MTEPLHESLRPQAPDWPANRHFQAFKPSTSPSQYSMYYSYTDVEHEGQGRCKTCEPDAIVYVFNLNALEAYWPTLIFYHQNNVEAFLGDAYEPYIDGDGFIRARLANGEEGENAWLTNNAS